MLLFFFRNTKLLSSGRGSFLALLAPGHAGGPPVPRRCKCGSRPGSMARALGVQSRENWKVTAGSLSAELEPSKTMENQHAGHCCKAQKHGDINRFKLSSVIQLRTLLWACRPLLYMCGHDVCVYALCVCLCVLRVRVSVFTGPSMTHASAYLVVAC